MAPTGHGGLPESIQIFSSSPGEPELSLTRSHACSRILNSPTKETTAAASAFAPAYLSFKSSLGLENPLTQIEVENSERGPALC